MSVHVVIHEGPLPPATPVPLDADGRAGAVLEFEGYVRELEDGRPLDALDYEVYSPMAQRQLASLGAEIVRKHGLCALRVEHSEGRVPVGSCSLRLRVEAPHRKEALAAADEFIDRLKRDVPIWKSPRWIEDPGADS